jgi:hypothetical protein
VKRRLLILISLLYSSLNVLADEIRFSRDVLPILSDRCFHCHGPDEAHRQAELRLDLHDQATKVVDGRAAVIPHQPDASELLNRITSSDPDVVMPPADSHRKALSQDEIRILRQWIEEGAVWGRHWAFEPPVRERVPAIESGTIHPIDYFVQRELTARGLSQSAPAERHTLLRRVSFDLTGLPPSMQETDAFLSDDSPDSFERVVDRLLMSPHFGERMAMWWLDAARYSDTDGYQQDGTRRNWPWRDWVIESFNQNKPFDQFTIEQFAGDLLPNATPEQQLATCFHRNHMTNGEGGRDPEESRIDYVIDRVNTTGTVWLGLTLGCAQCHSHKFDPVSHQDYYSLFAYFNSIDEDGRAGDAAKPYLKYKSPWTEKVFQHAQTVVDRRKPILESVQKVTETEFQQWLQAQRIAVASGFEGWRMLRASELRSVEGTLLKQDDQGFVQASGPNPRQDDYRFSARTDLQRLTGLRLDVYPHATHTDGKLSRGRTGEFILTDVKLQVRKARSFQLRDVEIVSAVADAESKAAAREYGQVKDTLDDDPRNGWTTATHNSLVPHTAVFALAEPLQLAGDEELVFVMLQRSTAGDSNIGRFRVSVTDQPGPAVRSLESMPLEELAKVVASADSSIPDELQARLRQQFLEDHAEYQTALADHKRAVAQLDEVRKASGELSVMVLAERAEPRATHILERGVWDKHGAVVQPHVPEAVLAKPAGSVATRLELARWLVDRDNPLTARVIVNHLWQMCFGSGLVRTPDDFGLQGERPTHPELLDWLAVEFMDSGWDVRHLLRLIVTSQTYQQTSAATEEHIQLDPENRWLARGARFRLPSWMIRDAALASSGLMNQTIGGPPFLPYQPDGVWAELFMGRFGYNPSAGTLQHRRTVYAFWRRSAAPTFLFDTAQRRTCEVRPLLTNTPLHALTLLNDETLLESSREVARRAIAESDDSIARVQLMFRTIVSRDTSDRELQVLLREHDRAFARYSAEPELARQLLDFGQPELRPVERHSDIAAGMVVASLIYNLDEAMTHE